MIGDQLTYFEVALLQKTRTTSPRLPATIAMRMITIQQNVLSQKKTDTPHKTSDNLDNLRVNELI